MMKLITMFCIIPFVLGCLYLWYKIDERLHFVWFANKFRKCKECRSYHKNINGNWEVSLKSSKYLNCNCYIFTKSRKQ